LFVVAFWSAACTRHGRPIALTDTTKLTQPPGAVANESGFTRVGITSGFQSPESAVFDSAQNVWLVSNIAGGAADEDHNGFISRLAADGTLDSLHFVKSGVNGAVLDAPKGLALHGDTIWVADIDVARGFDKRDGRPLATVDFRPFHALMLNAIAIGPDGRVYITDTAIRLEHGQPQHAAPDRIFAIGPGLEPELAVQDSSMEGADGISWDAAHTRFIVVGFTGKAITTWRPGDTRVQHLTSGVGQFDGDEMLPDGRALVSSWADSSLYLLEADSLVRVVAGGLPTPADLHADFRTMRLAIPLSSQNEVLFYQLPRRLARR
jgi:sugar lactone lactonase YvrE